MGKPYKQQVLLKLCAIESEETAKQAADLLAPFAAKLKKTKITADAAGTSNQQERNLVTASVRTLFALKSMRSKPPHPLVDREEFRQLVHV